MIGLEIVFKNFCDLTRFLSLNGMNLFSYYFYCVDHSIYYHSETTQFSSKISYAELFEISKRPYVIERLHLQVYQYGTFPQEIESYQDFVSSECEMIILAYDGVYLEIYARDNQWLNQLLSNAREIEVESINVKTLNTDTRKGMYV